MTPALRRLVHMPQTREVVDRLRHTTPILKKWRENGGKKKRKKSN